MFVYVLAAGAAAYALYYVYEREMLPDAVTSSQSQSDHVEGPHPVDDSGTDPRPSDYNTSSGSHTQTHHHPIHTGTMPPMSGSEHSHISQTTTTTHTSGHEEEPHDPAVEVASSVTQEVEEQESHSQDTRRVTWHQLNQAIAAHYTGEVASPATNMIIANERMVARVSAKQSNNGTLPDYVPRSIWTQYADELPTRRNSRGIASGHVTLNSNISGRSALPQNHSMRGTTSSASAHHHAKTKAAMSAPFTAPPLGQGSVSISTRGNRAMSQESHQNTRSEMISHYLTGGTRPRRTAVPAYMRDPEDPALGASAVARIHHGWGVSR